MNKFTTSLTLMVLQMANAQIQDPLPCDENLEPALWLTPEQNHDEMLPIACQIDPNDDLSNVEICDCYEEGFVNWDGICGRRTLKPCKPANYFSSEAYLALDASEKMDQLWTQLTANDHTNTAIKSPKKVKCQNFAQMYKHFQQGPGISYSHEGDELKNSRADKRLKLVHQQGIVAQAKYVPTLENCPTTEDSRCQNYTGIFKSGAENVIIRLSETGLHLDGYTDSVNPSAAFKFLRDGVLSGNQFGMVAFENSPDPTQPWNWFGKDLLTHLPQFKATENNMCEALSGFNVLDRSSIGEGECGPQTGGRWLSQASPFIFQNGNVRLAQHDEAGTEELNPVFPYNLKFVANPALTATTQEGGRFFDQLIEEGTAEIPEEGLLYEVYGRESPLAEDEYVKIGEIHTTSFFTQSLWGDERLYFQHGGLNLDLQHLPDGFRRDKKVNQFSPQIDLEKYGDWNNPSAFEAPEASEADIINGMVQTGCPFAYLIDYVNGLGSLDPEFERPVNAADGS